MPSAASASKTSTKRPFFEVASRRATASPRERIATTGREDCLLVSMRKLHVLRAAQSLDRSLTGSLPDPAEGSLCEVAWSDQVAILLCPHGVRSQRCLSGSASG